MVLISNVLPSGLIGLMTAALLAALMSTISAALNSVGTLVSLDILKRMRPSTPDKILLRTGRITSLVVILLAISWSPWIGRFESIFDAISIILSMLSPPVASVFVMGILTSRGNDRVALSTMIFGLLAGSLVFCLDFDPISGSRYDNRRTGHPLPDAGLVAVCWLYAFLPGDEPLLSAQAPGGDPVNLFSGKRPCAGWAPASPVLRIPGYGRESCSLS